MMTDVQYAAGFDLAKRLHDAGEADLSLDMTRMNKEYRRGYREYIQTLNALTKPTPKA